MHVYRDVAPYLRGVTVKSTVVRGLPPIAVRACRRDDLEVLVSRAQEEAARAQAREPVRVAKYEAELSVQRSVRFHAAMSNPVLREAIEANPLAFPPQLDGQPDRIRIADALIRLELSGTGTVRHLASELPNYTGQGLPNMLGTVADQGLAQA